jgi:hypothetical protein
MKDTEAATAYMKVVSKHLPEGSEKKAHKTSVRIIGRVGRAQSVERRGLEAVGLGFDSRQEQVFFSLPPH